MTNRIFRIACSLRFVKDYLDLFSPFASGRQWGFIPAGPRLRQALRAAHLAFVEEPFANSCLLYPKAAALRLYSIIRYIRK